MPRPFWLKSLRAALTGTARKPIRRAVPFRVEELEARVTPDATLLTNGYRLVARGDDAAFTQTQSVSTPIPTNLAQGKAATQSSTDYGGAAARAVDGNTSGNWGHASVTHTRSEANPWWQVDLASDYAVYQVKLFNRTDTAPGRLRNVSVTIIDANNTVAWVTPTLLNPNNSLNGPTTITVDVAALNGGVPVAGRKVKVSIDGTAYLSLAEVQVFGGTVHSTTWSTDDAVDVFKDVSATIPATQPLLSMPEGGLVTYRTFVESLASSRPQLELAPRYAVLTAPNGLTATSSVAQQQTLAVSSSLSSQFKLRWNGKDTAYMPLSASAEVVEAELNKPGFLPAGGVVNVTGRDDLTDAQRVGAFGLTNQGANFTFAFGGSIYRDPPLLTAVYNSLISTNTRAKPVTRVPLTKRDDSERAANNNGIGDFRVALVGSGAVGQATISPIPSRLATSFAISDSPSFTPTSLGVFLNSAGTAYETWLFGNAQFDSLVGAIVLGNGLTGMFPAAVVGDTFERVVPSAGGFAVVIPPGMTQQLVPAETDETLLPRPVTFLAEGMEFAVNEENTVLHPGTSLTLGQSVKSSDGRFELILQTDGNLVWRVAATGAVLWALGSHGQSVTRVTMQADGNLVAYRLNNTPVAATNTDGHPGAYLALQTDGRVIVYDTDGVALFTSNAVQQGSAGRLPVLAFDAVTRTFKAQGNVTATATFPGGSLTLKFPDLKVSIVDGKLTYGSPTLVSMNLGGFDIPASAAFTMAYDAATRKFTFSTTGVTLDSTAGAAEDAAVRGASDPARVVVSGGSFTITNGVLGSLAGLSVASFQIGRSVVAANATITTTFLPVVEGTGTGLKLTLFTANVLNADGGVKIPANTLGIYGQAKTPFTAPPGVSLPLGAVSTLGDATTPGMQITNGLVNQLAVPITGVTVDGFRFNAAAVAGAKPLAVTYYPPPVGEPQRYAVLGGALLQPGGSVLGGVMSVDFGGNGTSGLTFPPDASGFDLDFGVSGAFRAGTNTYHAVSGRDGLKVVYDKVGKTYTLLGDAEVEYGTAAQRLRVTATVPPGAPNFPANRFDSTTLNFFLDAESSFNGFHLSPQATTNPLRVIDTPTAGTLTGDFAMRLEGHELLGNVNNVPFTAGVYPATGVPLTFTGAAPWVLGGVAFASLAAATLTDTLTLKAGVVRYADADIATGAAGNEPATITAVRGHVTAATFRRTSAIQLGDMAFTSYVATYKTQTTPRYWSFAGTGTYFGNPTTVGDTTPVVVRIGGITGPQLFVGSALAPPPTPATFPAPPTFTLSGATFNVSALSVQSVDVTPTSKTYTLGLSNYVLRVAGTELALSGALKIKVSAAGAEVVSFSATIQSGATITIGGASLTVNSLTIAYNFAAQALAITGTANFKFKAASASVTATVSLGDASAPGLVIKDGAVQSLKLAVSGSFTVFALTMTVPAGQALTVEYERAQEKYVLYGTVKLSTAAQNGVRVIDNLTVTLGTGSDKPGIEILSGTLTALDVSVNGDINLFGLTASPKQLRVRYTADTNLVQITGGVDVTLASGLVLSAGLPGGGLQIDTGTGKVKIKGVSLRSKGDITFGVLTIKDLAVKYADDGTTVTISAAATLVLPSGLTVGGSFVIKNGALDAITIKLKKNPGILVAGGLINIYSIEGSVGGLTDLNNFKISATVKATVGPAITFAGKTYALADVSGTITVTPNDLTLDGSVNLVGGFFGKGQFKGTLTWTGVARVTFRASIELYPGGVIRGQLNAYVDVKGNVDFDASIGVFVPRGTPAIGNKSLGQLKISLRVRPELPARNSYVSFDMSVFNIKGGVTARFDAAVDYRVRVNFGFFKISKSGTFRLRDIDDPTVQVLTAAAVPGTQGADILFTATTTRPDATFIDLYADTTPGGHDGVLIGTVAYQGGTQTFHWADMASFASPGQPVYVYAVVNDREHPLGFSDYTAALATEPGFAPAALVPGATHFGPRRVVRFSFAGGNPIVIDDPRSETDAATRMQVVLRVRGGVLDLAHTSAAVDYEGRGTNQLVLTGTAADITALLDGLTYTPDSDLYLDDRLDVTAAFLPAQNLTSGVTESVPLVFDPMAVTLVAAQYTNGFDPSVVVRNAAGATPLERVEVVNVATGTIAGVRIAVQNYAAGDALGFSINDELVTGLRGSFDPVTGVLSLTGFGTTRTYTDAIRRVTFFSTAAGARSLTVTVLDDLGNVAALDLPVVVVHGIAAPTVGVGSVGFNYTPASGVVPLASTGTVTTPAGTTLTGMTVAFAPGGYRAGEDTLTYTGAIPGVFNPTTGVLTLTGTFDAAAYTLALRAVAYQNFGGPPTPGLRHVVVTVTSDANATGTAVVTIGVTAAATTFASPTLTLAATQTLPADGEAVALDAALTLTDAVPMLTGATVAIAGGYVLGVDVLGVTVLPDGIRAEFDPTTGTLRLSGAASVAEYEAVLRGVLVENLNRSRAAGRTLAIAVTVGNGLSADTTRTTTVDLAAAPYLGAGLGTVSLYTHGRTTAAVVSGLTADFAGTLTGATVAITAGYRPGEDELRFTPQNGITAAFDAFTGVLTLTGTATVAEYRAALETVRYFNTRNNPVAADRMVSFRLLSGATAGNVVNVVVRVRTAVVGPTATLSGVSPTYTEGGAPVAVAPSFTLTPADATAPDLSAPHELSGAEVAIVGYIPGEDVLFFTPVGNITGRWDAAQGRLVLTGTESFANYQAALRSVAYGNRSEVPTGPSRGVTFRLLGGSSGGVVGTATVLVQGVADVPVLVSGVVPGVTGLQNDNPLSLHLGGLQFNGVAAGTHLVFAATRLPSEALGRVLLADGTPVVLGQSYPLSELAGLWFAAALNGTGRGQFVFAVSAADDATGNVDAGSRNVAVSLAVVGVGTDTASEAYVAQVVRDLFGANPDAATVGFYARALDAALQVPRPEDGTNPRVAARAEVVGPLAQSDAFSTRYVHGVFRSLLGRDATPSELAATTTSLAGGGTLQRLRGGLAGTGEYFNLHSANGYTSFLAALYSDLLGRAPTGAESADGVASLTSGGVSVPAMAERVAASAEALRHTGEQILLTFLRRAAGPDDDADFLNAFTPAGEFDLIRAVLASTEYFNRHNTPTTSDLLPSQPTADYTFVGVLADAGGGKAGGTLVAPRFVLAAAHSVAGIPPGQLTFTIGGVTHRVVRVSVHPDYRPGAFDRNEVNDIAVLELDGPSAVAPARLFDGPPEVGDVLYLVGHGARNGTPFGIRRVGSTPAVDSVGSTVFVWTHDNPNDTTSTQGDSGSPLLLVVGGVPHVVGVVSGGTDPLSGLGDVSTNTRVDPYLTWIQGITGALSNATPPAVASVTRLAPPAYASNLDAVTFRVTFAEAVRNVDAADFTVSGGAVGSVVQVSPLVYDVTASGLAAFDGPVTLTVRSANDITDLFSNPLAGTAPTGVNESTYLLDHTAPSSSVNPLPAQTEPDFVVSWGGQDAVGGAGLTSFDVFVSVDGGAFVPWLTGVTRTSASYPSQRGHTYSFFTVATDAAGNREADTPAADATTTVTPSRLTVPGEFAVTSDAGAGVVRLFNPDATPLSTATPFPGYAGTPRALVADFNGDGFPDVLAATGPGAAGSVVLIDGLSGATVFSVEPFERSFTGGVNVAAGDLNGDGTPDIVLTADDGGGPRVRVFSGADFSPLADFLGIDDSNFRGGARAAVADLNGDGRADLFVAAAAGGGPRVTVYDGPTIAPSRTPTVLRDVFVFEPEFRGGVFLAAGDLDGDGRAELIAGPGEGGGPRVNILFASGTAVSHSVGDPESRGGARVAAKDLDGDGRADVVAAVGSRVRGYSGAALTAAAPAPAFDFDASPGSVGGAFVG